MGKGRKNENIQIIWGQCSGEVIQQFWDNVFLWFKAFKADRRSELFTNRSQSAASLWDIKVFCSATTSCFRKCGAVCRAIQSS